MTLAKRAALFDSGLGKSRVTFGRDGALLCFLTDILFGRGRSIIDKSGDPTGSLGEMLLSDFDVGLESVGAVGGDRLGGLIASGIGGISVTEPKDSFPRT